ncbi:MAG: hypothetical protein RLZZ399_1118 [Verrucomicrobiota bacterium]|jgi:hypothetical protein
MIPLAALPTFARLFPNFRDQCVQLHTLLLPIATVLLVCGLIGEFQHARSARPVLRVIATTGVIVMAIAFYGDWTDLASDALKAVSDQMQANPERTAQRYLEVLVAKDVPADKTGWFGLPSGAQMVEALLWGFLSLIGLIAQFTLWAAYLLQKFFVGLGYAFSPVFLGMLALRSTASIGVRYILGTVGILAWPLGWAAASIGTSNLIDLATEQGLIISTNVYGLQTILAGALIGGWIVLTTLLAPVIIQGALSSGMQIGSALLGGAVTAGAAAASGGATAAASMATGGAGGVGMALAAGASAVGSLAGSTMQGGGPPLSGSMAGSLGFSRGASGSQGTGTASATPSRSGERSTEGSTSASRTSAQPTSSFQSNDPTGDREASRLVGTSQSKEANP